MPAMVSKGNLGLAYERKGERGKALAGLQAAVALTPQGSISGKLAQKTARELSAWTDKDQTTGKEQTTGKQQAPAPLAVTPLTDTGRRVALIVGNSAYSSVAVLPNPRRDAETVVLALHQVGFQTVTLANDLSRDKLIDALRVFARDAEMADWALIYFAGHGIEMGGVNYLIPIDAKLETDRDVNFEAVPCSTRSSTPSRAPRSCAWSCLMTAERTRSRGICAAPPHGRSGA